jgi:hypothetical protein
MSTLRLAPPVAIDTFAWIFGVRAFLEEMEMALPEAESKARDNIRRLAEERKWDYSEYCLEEGELNLKFKHWLPRLAGYSAITLIHTVVETQLTATANHLRELYNHSLKVNDLRGDPVERAKMYFTKVAGIQVSSDEGWQVLRDVAQLRNIIVHRRGSQGSELKDQQFVQQLTQRYQGDISLSGGREDPDAKLVVSLAVCKRFIDETERFFERIFAAAGLPTGVVFEH